MLSRSTPARPSIHSFRREMDRLFNEMLTHLHDVQGGHFKRERMPVNVWEDDSAVYLEAETPGLDKSNLDVTVSGHELHLKGSPGTDDRPEGATVLMRERDASPFSRVIHLPSEIDADRIDAALDHGVLTITMPKRSATQSRRISVRSGSESR